MEAYCIKCKAKKELKDPIPVVMKNGKPAIQGICSVCGTRVHRMGRHKIEQTFENVPADRVFWCCDGSTINNLTELASSLSKMSDDIYNHHVTADKNDFSDWVKYVLGDDRLSEELRSANSPYEASDLLQSRLNL
jgi:hypothetical protein